MGILIVTDFFLITKFKEHNQVKQKLLDYIDCLEAHTIDKKEPLHFYDNADVIRKTDFWIDNREEAYIRLIYPLLKIHCKNIFKKTTANDISFTKIWFQQYEKNNFHGWHTHPNTHFTNVYFLELPDDSFRTEIKDLQGNIIEYKSCEGDILTFPGFYSHQSPVIDTDQRKTIISFNIELL